MIKTIIFDLGGVLVSLNKERCLNAFSNSLQFPNFGDYLNPYAQSGFFAKFENGDISSAEFRDIIRDIIREKSSAKELSDKQIDDALCAFLTDVDPKKVTMLLELKKKYRLLLLSNNNPIAWEECKTLFKEASGGIAIDDVFDKLYLSYQMNLSKPGEAIFNELLIKEGIFPHESLFIDDAPKNIETAKKLGFNVLLYNVEEDLCCKVAEILSND